jgi:hypothetical protein
MALCIYLTHSSSLVLVSSKLLLALVGTDILGAVFYGTRDHIFLSLGSGSHENVVDRVG